MARTKETDQIDGDEMTPFSLSIEGIVHLYRRVSKLAPAVLLREGETEGDGEISFACGAKRDQVLQVAKNEVLQRIRC